MQAVVLSARVRALLVATAAASTILVGLGLLGLAAGAAPGTNAGQAQVISPDTGATVTSGGSMVSWDLKLPASASCSGDTVHGYHAFGFVVDSTAVPDPGTLTFSSTGPVGGTSGQSATTGFPLASASGGTAADVNQAVALGTGQVMNPNGPYDWSFFSVDGSAGFALPLGTYNVGIACTKPGGGMVDVDKYWDVQVKFTASTSDPSREVWAVQSSSPPPTTTTLSGTTSTTTPGATTTTPGATTSTSSPTTTTSTSSTEGGSTSSTVSGNASGATSGSDPGSPQSLATTGASPVVLLLAAVALLCVGSALVLLGRRHHRAAVVGGTLEHDIEPPDVSK
jgi:hypothetical protein